jgi:hypothetical protein
MALGTRLNDQLPNPFVGNAAFVGTSFYTSATLSRAQLLRPFPQFQNINAFHVLEGKSRYNAAVFEWKERLTRGIGGSVSYTYSKLKDNQFGEENFYSPVAGGLALNNYNYISSYPRCTTTNAATTPTPISPRVCSTCPIAWSSHLSSSCRSARVRNGARTASLPTGWSADGRYQPR